MRQEGDALNSAIIARFLRFLAETFIEAKIGGAILPVVVKFLRFLAETFIEAPTCEK